MLRYLGLAHVESLHFSSILELSAFVSNFFLFFFDTRRDDQPTSTTFWIYRLEKQLSLALSSGIFISMVLFFLGTEQILSSVRDLERGRADVIHSLYADQFASLFALITCIL